jgi:hypothetical protein
MSEPHPMGRVFVWDQKALEDAGKIALSERDLDHLDHAMTYLVVRDPEEDKTANQRDIVCSLWRIWKQAGGEGKGVYWHRWKKDRPGALTPFVRECFRQAGLSELAPSESTLQAYLADDWADRRHEQNRKRRKPVVW